MTKTKLQQELKEKIKEGIKPSQLKRSKSVENLTPDSEKIADLQQAISTKEATNSLLNSENIRLQQELTFSQDTAQNYLERLQKLEPELDNKETEIKQLKKDKDNLEKLSNKLVDKNNELRLQALKDFDEVRENQQGIKQAVNELVNTEQTQINYQVQNGILLREKADLEQRLQTANERIQKLYKLKGLPNSAKPSFSFP
jgi:DNA-directed RNA polymerase subunit F